MQKESAATHCHRRFRRFWSRFSLSETLSKIAERYYGDPKLYRKIFEANRDLIKNPDLIQIGWKLRIP